MTPLGSGVTICRYGSVLHHKRPLASSAKGFRAGTFSSSWREVWVAVGQLPESNWGRCLYSVSPPTQVCCPVPSSSSTASRGFLPCSSAPLESALLSPLQLYPYLPLSPNETSSLEPVSSLGCLVFFLLFSGPSVHGCSSHLLASQRPLSRPWSCPWSWCWAWWAVTPRPGSDSREGPGWCSVSASPGPMSTPLQISQGLPYSSPPPGACSDLSKGGGVHRVHDPTLRLSSHLRGTSSPVDRWTDP
mmetsp:Transcript_6802/g.15056  ORF Transcript_6802/g.15056 Transcript_6802/m.15056 type:complete len:246 (-) Transcript_6802:896-1633(-)